MKAINKNDIIDELKRIGVEPSMELEVHSSLKSFGFVHPWYTIQNIAYEKGLIKDGEIGDCKCMFLDILSVTNIYKEELIRNPYKLYGFSR